MGTWTTTEMQMDRFVVDWTKDQLEKCCRRTTGSAWGRPWEKSGGLLHCGVEVFACTIVLAGLLGSSFCISKWHSGLTPPGQWFRLECFFFLQLPFPHGSPWNPFGEGQPSD